MNVISISKSFKSQNFFKKNIKEVLTDVSFDLFKGDILGITGPNGAGKTTLIKIILDLIEPSNGKILIENREKKYLAYINTNSRSFFWRISARDNLIFYGKLLDLSNDEIEESILRLSKNFKVNDILDVPFMELSSGQMQTFNIVRALLRKPDYLFFDEATTSMDIEKSSNAISVIKSFISKNKIPTVWCSHNLEEIDFICNKFSIINDGFFEILSKNNFKKMKNNYKQYSFEISKADFKKISENFNFKIINEIKDSLIISLNDKNINLDELLIFFVERKIKVRSIENIKNIKDFSFE